MTDAQTKDRRVYVAIAPHYWGTGESIEESLVELRKAGYRRKTEVLVKVLPAGTTKAWVDNFGTIHWQGTDDSLVNGLPEVVHDTRRECIRCGKRRKLSHGLCSEHQTWH